MDFPTRNYSHLLWEMTRCEWRMRDQATTLGFLWTLLHPLLMFGVLFGIFTRWMAARSGAYAGLLLIGIVQYGFFSSATSYGLSSLLRRRALLLNFPIPRETMVLAAVLSAAISYVIEFSLMMAFVTALGARPCAAWALLPALLLVLILLVAGLSLFLAPLAARYPDFERIWGILLSAGFFLTPIFYPLSAMDGGRRRLLLLNPMTHIIEMMRSCALEGRWPNWTAFYGLAGLSAAIALSAYYWFKAHELSLSDYLL